MHRTPHGSTHRFQRHDSKPAAGSRRYEDHPPRKADSMYFCLDAIDFHIIITFITL
jgi:hypothetical protein